MKRKNIQVPDHEEFLDLAAVAERLYFDNNAWNALARCSEPARSCVIQALRTNRAVLASIINCVELLNTRSVECRAMLCETAIAVLVERQTILPDALTLTRGMAHAWLLRRDYVLREKEHVHLAGFRSLLTRPASLTSTEAAALRKYAGRWNSLVEGIWRSTPDDWRKSSALLDRALVESKAMENNVSRLLNVSANDAHQLITQLPVCSAFACFVGAVARLGLRETYSSRQPEGMDLLQLPYMATVHTFVTGDRRFRRVADDTAEVLGAFGWYRPKVMTFDDLRKSIGC